ncbi:MAG: 4Fe-4S dicluster domain-containing protein [Thermodesulfobacteriota bacterium]
MKVKRKIIQIDEEACDGCGRCVTGCAEGALQVIDGKARVVNEVFCDGLGACIGECPTGALQLIEREAEEFDERAVEEHLHRMHQAGRCPSASIQELRSAADCEKANVPTALKPEEQGVHSHLSHWPIQIRLVPANASFLKNADLLVTADCVPVSYPAMNETFLPGRRILLGCPKFDNVQEAIDKFTQIFRQNEIRSLTTLIMEVPCCSGLPFILKKAMQASGRSIPLTTVVVSTRGEILRQIDS